MKPWLKLGSVVATLALLAACSSGIQQPDLELGDEAPELSTQGTSVSNVVPNSASDAEEEGNGLAYTTSTVLELGYKMDGTPQTTGIRFLDVAVPKGARITGAFIRFTAVTDQPGASNLTVAGQDVASGGPFSNTANNITSRTKTSARSTWQPGAWVNGQRYNSSSITGVIQEIVDRSDWQQGAAMVFIISGTGTRKAASYDRDSTLAPKLYVTYEAPSGNRFKADLRMKVDPNFSMARLQAYDAEAYSNYLKVSNASISGLVSKAREGTSRGMSRDLNYGTTTLLTAFRATGDKALLDKVATIMTAARNSLTTTTINKTSYRTWRGWEGNELDETLVHGFIARVAYAFELNRSVKPEYASQADFWKKYLKNDFERKWRAKTDDYGENIVDKSLMHSYSGMTAYHFYMYRLFGNTTYPYLDIANKRAGVMKRAFKLYNNGFVWPHRVYEISQKEGLDVGYQPNVYAGETISNIYDLALEGFSPFDDTAFMPKLSNGVRDNQLNAQHSVSSTQSYVFSADVGPGSCPAGTTKCQGVEKTFSDPTFGRVKYTASGYENGELHRFLGRPYALVGVWDSTGSIIQKARNYQKYSSSYTLPTAIVLNNLYKKGGFALGQ